MKAHKRPSPATLALCTLAEIKAATEGFDRGEANVFDALDQIAVAVAAFQAATPDRVRRGAA
ncbi:MAG: hypothetical protein RLZZ111_1332 [Planctomycetota bacterium]|jgi:hypothetical protein